MELSPPALAVVGLLLALWTGGAAWMMIAASSRARRADGSRKAARRLARMIDEAPAVPLLVRADGRLEGSDRLAGWLGFDALPRFLAELAGEGDTGLTASQLAELTEAVVRAQKTGAPFRISLTLEGSQRSIALQGALADPQVSPGGAALVWVFDFTESQGTLVSLRTEAAETRADFAALVGLIEAAPVPMWFRDTDLSIRLVNAAYVEAVGAEDAETIVRDQVELIEAVDGLTAAQISGQAAERGEPIERIVAATIDGERRAQRVSDLPIGKDGIAGYAVDIEEVEEQRRVFRAFREAQRSVLDHLSIGVGQFDAKRQLVFANLPYRRLFKLNSGVIAQGLGFEEFLTRAREDGRVPEVRDFPAWRGDHADWFTSGAAQEEQWPLSDGTHLRIVAQPMPDGGLVFIAEDQTEHLALSATRDTLLRTRTATFDSLFEALAVFAPDGHLQLWNRSFADTWGVPDDLLDAHPSAEELLELIKPNLRSPRRIEEIGKVIRAATLDRKEQAGRIAMADDRTLEFAGVPLPDGNGLLTVLDVTATEQAETALRERNTALEEADAVKTRFLANMSYELRTPLTTIGGFAELLQSGAAGELEPQGQEYLAAILTAVGRLTEQVENVLDLSQSEAGLLPLSREPVDLLPFVTDIVRAREQAIRDGGITLDLRGSRTSGRIDADPRQLRRAIAHLLDNAIAATANKGKILVDLSRSDAGARIVISDNGRGMDAATLKLALEGGDTGGRSGLGIPLARELVEAHGGTLDIVSEPGAGTTATVLLP